MRRHTPDEAAYIAYEGLRVELNALTSPEVIAFVESKLEEHGVTKVIPDRETLATASERALRIIQVNAFIRGESPDELAVPMLDDLGEQIRAAFDDDARPWDDVLADIAAEAVEEEK